MSKLSVGIWGVNPKDIYSGGRYHALMMAEALSAKGCKVSYITTHVPIFETDFRPLASHKDIQFYLTKDFEENVPQLEMDFLVVVPNLGGDPQFYTKAIRYSEQVGAKLVLLNFESPNWFNSLSPVPRDESMWDGWVEIAKKGDLILSSTGESNKYAIEFYSQFQSDLKFEFCYPSINSIVADKVNSKSIKKSKKIFMSTRFFLSSHKGADNITDLFCSDFEGYTFALMVGGMGVPDKVKSALEKEATKFGINLEYHLSVSDEQKFKLIASSSAVAFPSFFEGFGYPPVESLYLNTPCVAFDLQVVRETCGEDVYYARVGDWEDFRLKLKNAVLEKVNVKKDFMHEIYTIENFGHRLVNILSRL